MTFNDKSQKKKKNFANPSFQASKFWDNFLNSKLTNLSEIQ